MVSVATRVECANAVDCGQKLLQNVGQQMVSKFKSWSIVYPLMLQICQKKFVVQPQRNIE